MRMNALRSLDELTQDLRYALRSLRKSPGFTMVAVLSLALGSGANTAIFQLLDAIRLRALPVARPEELVEIRVDDMTHARGTWVRDSALTNPLWEKIREQREPFSGLLAWADEPLEIARSGDTRQVAGLWVSGDFFHVLGVHPLLGRVFAPVDDHRGCGLAPGAVLSEGFWRQEFGGNPDIVGHHVPLGKSDIEIIGVTPKEFFGLEVGRRFDIALPICAEPAWHGGAGRLDSGTVWWLTVMARLRPEVSRARAAAFLRARSAEVFEATLPSRYPSESVAPYQAMKLTVSPAAEGLSHMREQYSTPLVLLLVITGLVLLIACVNLAHLMLARAAARQRDVAVRLAIGASGLRLARQLIAESLLLAIAGVAAGLLMAQFIGKAFVTLLSDRSSPFLDLSLDVRTFAFTIALSVLTCVMFAAIPVLRVARADPALALGAGNRPGIAGARVGFRRILIITEVALSLLLLTGALVFARSLKNLEILDAGFQPHGLVINDVNYSDLHVPPERALAFRRELLTRIRATPAVEAAAEVVILPGTNSNWNNRIWMEGADPAAAPDVYRNMIGSDYFRTMGTTVIAGREFDEQDASATAPKVAIVNEAFAHKFVAARTVLGQHLWVEATPFEPSSSYEIVGVVKDSKYLNLREDFRPIVFVPLSSDILKRPAVELVVRSRAQSAAVISSVRRALDGLSPGMRYSFRVFDAVLQDSVQSERLMATLSEPFAALAVLLTAVGLYGIALYTVAQRTREIGIRLALGAEPRAVTAVILREAATVTLLGLCIGAFLTVAAGRTVSALLFGLEPYDPGPVSLAACLVTLVVTCASYLPARRAARIDPLIALRSD